MMHSTIYVKCPNCGKTALVQQLQGQYLCANCNYDYTKLKDEPNRLDEFLLSNLREGPMGQLMALTMHRWITLIQHEESVNYVKQLAKKNGIEWAGDKKGCFWSVFEKLFFRKKTQ